MANESEISLKVSTAYDPSGMAAATGDVAKLGAATQQATASVEKQATVAGNLDAKHSSLSASTQKVNTTTANTGQTMLTFGRILQDGVAAGLPGMVNNFEGLAMALGLGGGVAGAVTVAAVAVQVLMPLLEKAEDNTQELAEAASEQAAKSAAAARQAAEDAELVLTMAAAQDELKRSLDDANAAYEAQLEAAKAVRKEREEAARLLAIEGDAQAQLEMAKIEDARSRGAILPEEAERRKQSVSAGAVQRTFAIEQEKRLAAEEEARAMAAAARQKQEALLTQAGGLSANRAGMLSEEERKQAEAALKAAEDRSNQERGALTTAQQRLQDDASKVGQFLGPSAEDVAFRQQEVRQREERVRKAAEESRALREKLARDEAAQKATGFKSPQDLDSEIERLAKLAQGEGATADKQLQFVAGSERTRGVEKEAFTMRQQASELRGGVRLREMQEAERDRQMQQQQEARREQEQQRQSAGRNFSQAGRNLLAEAGQAGASDEGLRQLREAMAGAAAGDAERTKTLGEILAIMAQRRQSLQDEIDELKAALASLQQAR